MELNANEETTCKQQNGSFSSDKYTFQADNKKETFLKKVLR